MHANSLVSSNFSTTPRGGPPTSDLVNQIRCKASRELQEAFNRIPTFFDQTEQDDAAAQAVLSGIEGLCKELESRGCLEAQIDSASGVFFSNVPSRITSISDRPYDSFQLELSTFAATNDLDAMECEESEQIFGETFNSRSGQSASRVEERPFGHALSKWSAEDSPASKHSLDGVNAKDDMEDYNASTQEDVTVGPVREFVQPGNPFVNGADQTALRERTQAPRMPTVGD